MKEIFKHVKDVVQGKASLGERRSSHWPKVRKEHLEKSPNCAICGGSKKLQVHHKRPFNSHPELELDPQNLITLCEDGGKNCHLNFGHLQSFRSFNPSVEEDSKEWSGKIKNRPDNKPGA